MKFLLLSLSPILLIGCSNPIPKKYTVKVQFMPVSSRGDGPATKVDTIKAYSDEQAYSDGLKTWWGILQAEKLLKNRVSISHSYAIYDSDGLDLKIKLPINVTDSIEKQWANVIKGMK